MAWAKDIILLAINEDGIKTKEHGNLTGIFSGELTLL